MHRDTLGYTGILLQEYINTLGYTGILLQEYINTLGYTGIHWEAQGYTGITGIH